MKTAMALVCAALLTCALSDAAIAQRGDGGRRNQDGGINYAPQPGIYTVVSVDSDDRIVRIRAADGNAANVHVGEGVFDVSKLSPGDKIQVDFLVPDGLSNKLSAATIWRVK
jgi:hypothetical protein